MVAFCKLPLGHIVGIGCRTNDGMYQPRISIHVDVGVDAEVPLVALLCLVHFRITLAVAVLA